jgi:hypothetical protein
MDPTRRQAPPPVINAGSLAKQKSPVRPETSTSKDAVVSCLIFSRCLVLLCDRKKRGDSGVFVYISYHVLSDP